MTKKRYPNIQKTPAGTYRARFTDAAGKTRSIGTFPTLAEALAARDEQRASVTTGTYVPPEVGSETLASFAARWLDRCETRLKATTVHRYRTVVRLYITADVEGLNLGVMPLRTITPTIIADWHSRVLTKTSRPTGKPVPQRQKSLTPERAARRWLIAQGYDVPKCGRLSRASFAIWQAAGKPTPVGGSTAPNANPNKGKPQTTAVYQVLHAMLNDAHREGLLPQGQPCNIRGAGRRPQKERPLITLEDAQALAAAMPEHLRMLVTLAATAGLRRGELLALRRDAITFTRERGEIVGARINVRLSTVLVAGNWITTTPKSEAGKRVVPLAPDAAKALHEHLERFVGPGGDALVFTNSLDDTVNFKTLQRAWFNARKQCGLPTIRLHDLRHFAATEFRRSGADLEELKRLMGHSNLDAVQIYQHVDIDDLDRIAARLGERRAAALAGRRGGGARN